MEKNTNQLMHELMNQPEIQAMSRDRQREIWQLVSNIALAAKEDVVKDAEKAIQNLRVFSLR